MNEHQRREAGATGDAMNREGRFEARDRSPEEIEREIEATRERMSHNIDALGEKLSPHSLKEQAKDAITGAAQNAASNVANKARRTGSRMADAFRDNAIPVTMVGIGVTWMLLKRNSDSDRTYTYTGPERRAGYSGYGSSGYGYGASSPAYGGTGWSEYAGETDFEERNRLRRAADTVSEKVSGAAHSVGDKVSGVAHSIADTASSAAHSVREKSGDIARRAGDLGSNARDRARNLGHRARGGFEDTLEDNPLAIAAGATLLGLAVGLLFPASERENRMMGPTRDRLVDTARETAREVKEVATESARAEAEGRKSELRETARQVVDQVKESASRVAQDTKDAAVETAKETARSKKPMA
jgi:gas vesicle protein